ncbi:probable peroxygenase 3 [Aspergillus udagawae]|nr:probable peroxygenase 3 [Aspergillus udagawae]
MLLGRLDHVSICEYLRAETRHPWDPTPQKQDIFDPADEKTFKSRILLEVVTNYVVNHGSNLTHHDSVPHHPCGHAMELTRPLEPSYECYRYLTVMAGPSFKNTQRVQQIHGSSNYMAAYKFNTSGSIDSALAPTLVPDVWKDNDRQKDRPDEFTHEDYLLTTYTYTPEQDGIPDGEYTREEPDLPDREKERQRREPDQWPVGFRIGTQEMVQGEPSLGCGVKPEWTARFQIDALRKLPNEADARECIKLFDSGGASFELARLNDSS